MSNNNNQINSLAEYKILHILKQLKIDIAPMVYDYFIDSSSTYNISNKINSFHYISMTNVGGISLHHLWLEYNRHFTLSQCLTILDQMLVCLYKLHSIGYIHNDINHPI